MRWRRNIISSNIHSISLFNTLNNQPPPTKTINMQFSIVALGLGLASLTSAISVSYDTGYDDASRSLNTLSCSDGANGLVTRFGWNTQGNVPSFPRIGGYSGIAGWNSPQVCSE
jgi:hypothetical protein